MALFSGLRAKHRVDYGGRKNAFRGAKNAYRAGETVTLYFDAVALDTNYSFYLDDAPLEPDYSEGNGYILSFPMPDRGVSLRVESRSSMVYIPADDENAATLTFDSFDGGGPVYSVKIEDPSIVTSDKTKQYDKPYHDAVDGAAYRVTFTFFALKPGKTTVTISSRSPICEAEDREYTVFVDSELTVRLEEKTAGGKE